MRTAPSGVTGRRRQSLIALAVVAALALPACGAGTPSPTARAAQGRHRSDDTPPAAGLPDATSVAPGPLTADLGFRPETQGFSFANYGTDPNRNLTAVEMRALFGDGVCANQVNGCELIPPAQDWMDLRNRAMAGGHCQGMSVTALLFYKGRLRPSDFGADSVPALQLAGNDALQGRIAQSWAFQSLPSVVDATVHGTPTQIVDALAAALRDRGPLTFGLGIYKPDRTGGHEITPFALVDRGGGKVGIEVYDNNYPKVTREVVVDRDANSWNYSASTNPGEAAGDYTGNAQTNTLEIDPMEPGVGVQPCPFCGAAPPAAASASSGARAGAVLAAETAATEEISLDADSDNHGHLLITDDQGRRIGYAGGAFVNDLPGASAGFPRQDRVWKESEEPVYEIPTGSRVTITLDGTPLTATDTERISMIGPGIDLNVDNLEVGPGEKETVTISADRTEIGYTAGGLRSPLIQVGADTAESDHAFSLTFSAMEPGASITVRLTGDGLEVKPSAAQTFDLEMLREDDAGEATFKHPQVAVPAGATANLQYSGWHHHGESIPLMTTGSAGAKHLDLDDRG